jgi:hypothetical protein
MRYPVITMLFGALVFAATLPRIAAADMLISEAEAKLPQAADSGIATRGITRGPGIEVLSPAQGAENVKSPLALKVKFVARNNVAIDPASVKLTYIRTPAVDLTERVKPFLTKDGIDMAKADVPPGKHLLRIDVKDADGRTASSTFTLSVGQ